MGVDGLLGFAKKAQSISTINRSGLANSTAAVDISHWIYRATYACPEALYHRNEMTAAYKIIINYIDNYVKLLKEHGVQLTFVFDGLKLPAKQVTHQARAAKKAEARKEAEKCLAKNDKAGARKQMLRCVDIRFDIVEQVIAYCKREKIRYYVAPYEADAQIAFLNINNYCEFVITEDTDLILYGCKKIIYKLDQSGNCVLYQKSKLGKCLGNRGDEVEFERFRRICILSGCDYLKNIPSVGLQSAKKFFLMTKQDNLQILLPKLPTYLKSSKIAGKVTEEYIKGFIDAENTFKYHIVYDPNKEKLRPLEHYPKGRSASDYPQAGLLFHPVQASELVKGNINLDCLDPDKDLDSADSDTEDDEGAGEENIRRAVPSKLS